ncbi:PRC-barrel domain-containing protein [Candidatus Woesearchaeota archaeon]|nr:PRC-barrel domain-containing protein [Candidatus Woesearchaeota archaeon]
MVEIRKKSMPMNKTVNMNKVLGKKVLSKDGQDIGKVGAVHVDPKTMTLQGITIDKGIFETNDYIGRNYIENLSNSGAVLNITPIKEFLGLEVFDSKAKKIGKVKEIRRTGDTNQLLSIVVDRGLTSEDLIVTENEIKEIGDNVMLATPVKEDVEKSNK